jgi:hypothetical protein
MRSCLFDGDERRLTVRGEARGSEEKEQEAEKEGGEG